jgi:hypothetical protein
MKARLTLERLNFSDELVDVRDLNGEALLASPAVSDDVPAILTRLRDRYGAVRRIPAKIAVLTRISHR